jgi:effector-binding domain-containing protein
LITLVLLCGAGLRQAPQRRLTQLAARVAQVAAAGRQPRYEVLARPLAPIRVAAATRLAASEDELPELLREVERYIASQRATPAGPPIVLFHSCDEAEVELELAVPVDRDLPASSEVRVEQLPAVQQAACMVFAGFDQDIGAAYASLAHWMEASGHAIVRPTREVYLQGDLVQAAEPGHAGHPYVIEVQFPITPRY